MDKEMNDIIEDMINNFINDPIRKYGTGNGSSTKRIETIIVPDGRMFEVHLTITADKKYFLLDKEPINV